MDAIFAFLLIIFLLFLATVACVFFYVYVLKDLWEKTGFRFGFWVVIGLCAAGVDVCFRHLYASQFSLFALYLIVVVFYWLMRELFSVKPSGNYRVPTGRAANRQRRSLLKASKRWNKSVSGKRRC
jgi:hypothetical protein